ncbi:conserved exported hypothetical protein [Desulfamplus magnetovallimortis]|uniref:Uncharacterized protein n=1 Tax=Desulfamplus magnetovallimortis TaxID=1246637 RepID=A0A1W1HBY9_9BACT|nr:helix-hairpin-helix domain-containing protein [Desulfamplus magnetovallimortis]SLM30004.1 conserved exported hypothetical protein [Desulfamplus magnetovallimortis]
MKIKKWIACFFSIVLIFSFVLPVSASDKKININKATAEELSEGLTRVGPKYAQAIVDYREAHGEFKTPEEIVNVKGIGDKIFEINKDIIVVKDDEGQ